MPKSNKKFSVRCVIICDEIRREDSGKYIIIGIYDQNIRVPSFPFAMTLTFWIHGTPHFAGELNVQWRIYHNKSGSLSEMGGRVTVVEAETDGQIIVKHMPVQIAEEGILSIQMKENKGRWRTLKSIPVIGQPIQS